MAILIQPDLKAAAEDILDREGVNMSAYIRLCLLQLVEKGEIPFPNKHAAYVRVGRPRRTRRDVQQVTPQRDHAPAELPKKDAATQNSRSPVAHPVAELRNGMGKKKPGDIQADVPGPKVFLAGK